MFVVDQLVRLVCLKIFGTSRPKLFKFTNDGINGGVTYDPYFEIVDDKLVPRKLPQTLSNDVKKDIEKIKNMCYWMDESFMGINVSRFMNYILGAKEIALVEEAEHEANADVATQRFKSRRFGIGFGPLIQLLPFFGNYIVLALNLWVFYCMFTVGLGFTIVRGESWKFFKVKRYGNVFLGFKDVGNMAFNIIVDYGIGLIPFVSFFVNILHRSNSRNLAIFRKSLNKRYSDSK